MSQVSKYPISKDVEERIFEVFTSTLAKLNNQNEIDQFLNVFLSPIEKVMLAKRLSIALLLAKGYLYDDIRKTLRVSPPTISQVALAMKYSGKGYRNVVEKIIKEEKMQAFWDKLDDLINNIVPPKGTNWSYWNKERWAKKRARQKAF